MVTASITGAFKMILMIVGALVLLRIIGQIMNARRNGAEQSAMEERERKIQQVKENSRKNLGKTRILDGSVVHGDVEDVNYEDVGDS